MTVPITPDGVRYLAMGRRLRVPRPFHLRWLVPWLCGDNPALWTIMSRVSILALAPLAWWYTGSPWMMACAALPGVAFSWRAPVLVDAPGMALALLAACLASVSLPAAILVALVAGCCRETAPVWAAVYAWNPLLLVGLVPVAVRALLRAGPDPLTEAQNPVAVAAVRHPVAVALEVRRGAWLDPAVMVAPWGGLIVALAAPTTVLWVALGLGYAQLVAATDGARLYQWAWPVVAVSAVAVVPEAWLPLLALSIAFNPWKGPGA